MTIEEMQAKLVEIQEQLRARGYTRVSADFRLDPPECGTPFNLSINGALPGEDKVYEYVYAGSLEQLMERLPLKIEESFPLEIDARKRKFAEAMAKLAEQADKLGETIPEYTDYAEMLREHLRSNLLTSK